MFNPHCRETKGCFNPTVSGEGGGGSGEGCGRWGGGCCGCVGGDFVRESARPSLLSVSHSRHVEEYTATGIMTSELCFHAAEAHTEGTY